MHRELSIALLAGFGGMFGWGLADFFAKKTIDEAGDIVTLTWAHVFGTSLLVGLLLWQATNGLPISHPPDGEAWLLLPIFGVGQAVIYVLVYRGFAKGQVGLLAPVFASFSGLTAVLSIAIFGEVVRGFLLFSLSLIFGGVLLLSLDAKELRLRRLRFANIPGSFEVGTATILAACWTLSWNKFVAGREWLTAALWMYGFMTFAIVGFALVRRTNLRSVRSDLWQFLILIGLCEAGAYVAITLGYSATHFTSIVAILSGAFALPTIVLARLFLKERVSNLQTIGGCITVLGIMLLASLGQG